MMGGLLASRGHNSKMPALVVGLAAAVVAGFLSFAGEATEHRSHVKEARLGFERATERLSWMLSSYFAHLDHLQELVLMESFMQPMVTPSAPPSRSFAILADIRSMRGEVNAGIADPRGRILGMVFEDRRTTRPALAELLERAASGSATFGIDRIVDEFGDHWIARWKRTGARSGRFISFVVFSTSAISEIVDLASPLPFPTVVAMVDSACRTIDTVKQGPREGALSALKRSMAEETTGIIASFPETTEERGYLFRPALVVGQPLFVVMGAERSALAASVDALRLDALILPILFAGTSGSALVLLLRLRGERKARELAILAAQEKSRWFALFGSIRETFLQTPDPRDCLASSCELLSARLHGSSWLLAAAPAGEDPAITLGGRMAWSGWARLEELAGKLNRGEGGLPEQDHPWIEREGRLLVFVFRIGDGAGTPLVIAIAFEPAAEAEELEGFIVNSGELIGRLFEIKVAESSLRRSLEEKSVLLREIHHRVKNSLQLVSSILSIQAVQSKDVSVIAQFDSARRRVLAVAAVHEHLYGSETLSTVRLDRYTDELVSLLIGGIVGMRCTVHIDVPEPIEVPVEIAVPCGLIVSELVTNSIKYAFPEGRKGTVRVAFRREGGQLVLEVEDDGVGQQGAKGDAGGIGKMLVEALATQLKASLQVSFAGGCLTSLRFAAPWASGL